MKSGESVTAGKIEISGESRQLVDEAIRSTWSGIEKRPTPDEQTLFAHIAELEKDRARLREFVAWCMRDGSWMGGDIDGGSAQDKAEELGLIVEVPADEEFRAEYDCDTMFVLAWSQAAEQPPESPSVPVSASPSGGD